MFVLITYDVSTETQAGRKRLNKVAKTCVKHGQRVQNSVFECAIDFGTFIKLKNTLIGMINPEEDSLRFYNLGNKYETKVEHFGVKPSIPLEGTIIV